eukprot:4167602-Prymnesium_polylepis.1
MATPARNESASRSQATSSSPRRVLRLRYVGIRIPTAVAFSYLEFHTNVPSLSDLLGVELAAELCIVGRP